MPPLRFVMCAGTTLVAAGLPSVAVGAETRNVPAQYATIQAGIDAAQPGDEVVIADGVYVGAGNKDLDFHGKSITLRSASDDPNACIIDCENSGRGFYFHSLESAATVLRGITIRNGYVTAGSIGGARGAGVYCNVASPTLVKCTLTGNSADGTAAGSGGGGICCSSNGTYSVAPTLLNCTIVGNNTGASGGGVYCRSTSSPRLIACVIANNIAGSGGGVYCDNGSVTLGSCTIVGNTASGSGGGAACYGPGLRLSLINCTMLVNAAGARGGGVYCEFAGLAMTNCLLAGNLSGTGGGAMYFQNGGGMLTNCTIVRNASGVYCYLSPPHFTNCILWANGGYQLHVAEVVGNPPVPVVAYCDIQGGWGTGPGNRSLDPLFRASDGPDGDPNTFADNDYRLAVASPCIDAGDNTAVPVDSLDLDGDGDPNEPVPFDLAGFPRFVDDRSTPDTGFGPPPTVDLGAYEFRWTPGLPGDTNCDGVVNADDINPFVAALRGRPAYYALYPNGNWINADCNGDGGVTYADINPFIRLLSRGE